MLALGFKGRYGLNDPERVALVSALGERVPPFAGDPQQPILAHLSGRQGLADWLRRWPVSIGVSLVLVSALWLGLNYWLDGLVAALRLGGGQ